MAVVQISRLQVRRGQTSQTGVPQLSSGEFGWSIDTQELYIGNGSVDEGAPAVGNTQIITEHNISNFFSLASTDYQYGGSAPAVIRPLTSKLDDFVTLNDFIPPNNTSTFVTKYLIDAVNTAAAIRKPLYIMEGTYMVSATIFVPQYTEIRGAGFDKTNIISNSTSSVIQTISTNGFVGDSIPSDSTRPHSINLTGLSFINSTTNANPILQLDCISDSRIEYCKIVGDQSLPVGSSSNATGIDITDNMSGLNTKNLYINNNIFAKLGKTITSDYDVHHIVIGENNVSDSNEGIIFGRNLTGIMSKQFGPQDVLIENNKFDTISGVAVYSGNTSTVSLNNIRSVGNVYSNVGTNATSDATNQVTNVLQFNTFGNMSVNDTFDRISVVNTADFSTGTVASISPISGSIVLKSSSVSVYNITSSNITSPVFSYPKSTGDQVIQIEYTISKPSISMVRNGILDINITGNTASIQDNYTSNVEELDNNGLPTGVIFSVVVNTANNLVIINQLNKSNNLGTISYSYIIRQ